jgi:hypothetical protein
VTQQLQDEEIIQIPPTAGYESNIFIRHGNTVQKYVKTLSFALIFCLWGLPFTVRAYVLGKKVSFTNMHEFLLINFDF